MFYLYYNNLEKKLLLTEEKVVGRGVELLETNASLEAITLRSQMYEKQYQCVVEKYTDKKVAQIVINKYRYKNKPKKKRSPESIERYKKAKAGENNPRWGTSDSPEMRKQKSDKLKEYYKFNVHGKKDYKDSLETRAMKSKNNNNKGGWFWICNSFTGEEKRCYDEIPVGWRRGRLRNYISSIRKNQ